MTQSIVQVMRPLLTAVMPTFSLTTPLPPEGEPEGFWAIAPDLVIEIVSPSESAQMVHEKVADYVRAGTQLLWVVYPTSQTVMEYGPAMDARRLTIEDDLEGGEVVPGFCYPLKCLFA
jgi:Uma2 family endonuclease